MLIWLITGCSSGFGRALATAALAGGHRVAVTARDPADVADIIAPYDRASALALRLDVTDPEQVAAAVGATRDHNGSIDVLVNNAGISYFGGVEESDESDVRRLFEINFFGLMRMTNAVLPHMRQQGSGTIVNMASIAGLNGFASVGYYSASKFAVEGISEALAQEVQSFGIRVLLVEPSGFRTEAARPRPSNAPSPPMTPPPCGLRSTPPSPPTRQRPATPSKRPTPSSRTSSEEDPISICPSAPAPTRRRSPNSNG